MITIQMIKKLPPKSGVYFFKDKSNNVLYVGKAINIKKRIKNYFNEKPHENRIKNLLFKAEKIEYILTNSEIETLLLEAKLIKQYLPPFNVRLKDDRRYLYVGITNEKFPRVFLLRRPEKTNNLLYWFGPFPSAQSIKEILRLLRRIFPFRSCENLPKRVCLYFHLKLCPGVCESLISRKEYLLNIKKIKTFLEGNISFLIRILEEEMKKNAQNLAFEQAGKCRNQILMIQNMLGKFRKIPEEEEIEKQLIWLRKILIKYQKIDPFIIHRLEAYDIANLGKNLVVGAMVVFINGEPQNSEYRQFKLKTKFKGDPQALKEILKRRLNHREWIYPQLILIDGGKTQLSAAVAVLQKKKLIGQIGILGLTKNRETLVVPLIEKNKIISWKLIERKKRIFPILQYARDEAHRFAQRYYKKLHQKITLSFEQE